MRTEPLPDPARSVVSHDGAVQSGSDTSVSNPQADWYALGKSVRGAVHTRLGRPNEDALSALPQPANEYPIVIAIADGVGSERCFRSAIGSALAVESATTVLRQLVTHIDVLAPPSRYSNLIGDTLPRGIVLHWEKEVEEHLIAHPMRAHEQAQLPHTYNHAQSYNPYLHAYSATVLAVAITATAIVYVQLGDGDLLTVSPSGMVSRPLGQDRRLIANETTALGTPEAWHAMRCHVQPLQHSVPALVMLATDGYANSYRTDQDFLQVAADILVSLKEDGPDVVDDALESWLHEVSQTGSGDDITVALMYRPNVARGNVL